MKNVPTSFSSLKSEVDKLDADKLVPVPADLSKLCEIVKNDVVKKDVYNANNTTVNAEINELQNEIPSITNLASTTTGLANAEKKNLMLVI